MALAFVGLAFQLCAAAFNAAPDDGWLASEPLRLMALSTWNGKVVVGRIVLLAPLAAAILMQARRATLWLVALNLLLLPWSGHAAGSSWPALAFAVFGLHAASALVWIGGVGVLAYRAWRSPNALNDHLKAFSPLALRLVAVAVISGCGVALFQIDSMASLFATLYGRLMLIKALALLPVALAAAAWLRRYLARRDGDPRLALAVEALAGAILLAIASLMSQSAPPGDLETSAYLGLTAT